MLKVQKLLEKIKIQNVYNNEAIDHREDVHKSGDPAYFFFILANGMNMTWI